MLLYFSGSMIMKEPSEECVIDFWRKGTLRKLPVKSSNPRFIMAASILRESCTDADICREKLELDFLKLFDEKGLKLAPARESAYIMKTYNTLDLKESAEDFYRSYSWNPDARFKVTNDHLGIELLFLTFLIDKLIKIDDDPCVREMRSEIRRFIDQHILSWIPGWSKDVQDNADTSCYKGISTLIHACVEDIHAILS